MSETTCAFGDPLDASLYDVVWRDVEPTSGKVACLIEHGSGRGFSRGVTRRAVDGLAGELTRAGVQPGDVVVLGCDNGFEFVVAYHAVLKAGGVIVFVEPLGADTEWLAALSAVTPRHAVVTTNVWDRLRALPPARRLTNVVVANERFEFIPVDGDGRRDDVRPGVGPLPAGHRVAMLATSSGTQGTPKQVVLTHRNLGVNLAQIDVLHRLTPADVVLGVTPFRHIYGMQMAMNGALRAGATLVTVPTPFTADDFLDVVETRGVTVAYLVPSIIAELAALPPERATRTAGLRLIFSGGAPLATSAAADCSRRLGATIVQGYGMTEAGCCIIMPDEGSVPDQRPVPPSSVGVPLPGTDLRLVDPDTGAEVADGQAGEIWVHGPQVSPGFLDETGQLVPVSDAKGWLRTGDLARRDPAGYVTIEGRNKELIKYKGHQVSPHELETVLLGHPGVADTVVVGVPDPVAGELPLAYVVLREHVDLDDLAGFVADRVAPYKKIRLFETVDHIPRSGMGKARITDLEAATGAARRRYPAEVGHDEA